MNWLLKGMLHIMIFWLCSAGAKFFQIIIIFFTIFAFITFKYVLNCCFVQINEGERMKKRSRLVKKFCSICRYALVGCVTLFFTDRLLTAQIVKLARLPKCSPPTPSANLHLSHDPRRSLQSHPSVCITSRKTEVAWKNEQEMLLLICLCRVCGFIRDYQRFSIYFTEWNIRFSPHHHHHHHPNNLSTVP